MKQRIITGVIAGAAFIGMLALGGWFYTGLLLVMAMIGFWEYIKLNGQSWRRVDALFGFAAVVLLVVPDAASWWNWLSVDAIVWLLMFVLLSATVFSKNRVQLEHASVLLLGAIYIGFGFHYMAVTRELTNGVFWSALTFVAIWASDAGAYFVGRAIGRHKLWPAISPNKTIEGALGGLVIAVIAACLFAVSRPELLSYGQAVAVGVAAAVAGQLGDLVQSAYKRYRGVKDSGNLLPGHGGILDRTDSWLIVFPFVHLIGLL